MISAIINWCHYADSDGSVQPIIKNISKSTMMKLFLPPTSSNNPKGGPTYFCFIILSFIKDTTELNHICGRFIIFPTTDAIKNKLIAPHFLCYATIHCNYTLIHLTLSYLEIYLTSSSFGLNGYEWVKSYGACLCNHTV